VSAPADATPLPCPACDQAMSTQRFDGNYGRVVDLDLCHGCGLIWFDRQESLALTPGAVLKLFVVIDAHRDRRHPLGALAPCCPRCRQPLVATIDQQRATRFSYWRCPVEHGRLTTFFDFLREKNFVRPLSPERLAELRRYASAVNCSACGAPIDLAHESACAHCGAPLSMLDPEQVQAAVRDLQSAEARRTTVDPTYPARLMMDRATLERAFHATPGELRGADVSGAFGVVEAGVAAIVRLLSENSGPSAP